MTAKEATFRADAHLRVLAEIGELANQSATLDTILEQIVQKVAESLSFDVVSIYLHDRRRDELVLHATYGLSVDRNKPIHMKTDEGLTGLVYETRRPLSVMPASKHPRYKYFPETGEKRYESYLGVPIVLSNRCLGVLVGQMAEERVISPAEGTLFTIISHRLAGLLEVADNLKRLKSKEHKGQPAQAHQGKGLCGDYSVGHGYIVRGFYRSVFIEQFSPGSEDEEVGRLKQAFDLVKGDIERLLAQLSVGGPSAAASAKILQAHLMILKDESFHSLIAEAIKQRSMSAEQAIVEEAEAIAREFDKLDDAYMKDRGSDFREIGERLIGTLLRQRGIAQDTAVIPDGAIIIAREIGAGLLASLGMSKVAGAITEVGGETSHAVILAQSLGIPLVTNIEGACNIFAQGQKILIDGRTGFVFTNPDASLISEYEDRRKQSAKLTKKIEKEGADMKGAAIDINITANIGCPADIEMASRCNIHDVGLFRTEFGFMQFQDWPTVEQQETIYQQCTKGIPGYVTVRTLDVGGDKMLPYMTFPQEENPLLGLRSVRFSMEYLDIFRDQVKAILLQAAKGARLRIMLPMVSNVWEVQTAWAIIRRLADEINLPSARMPKLGIMVEVPAAICQLADFASLIDFISVGTNDLVQYLLAVDRNSSTIGHLYSGFHPAVMRTLGEIRRCADTIKMESSICGELAGSPAGALAVIALGYRNLSVLPSRAPVLRYLCKKLTPAMIKDVELKILSEPNEPEIRRYLRETLEQIDPLLANF